jgi:hypothetical protein
MDPNAVKAALGSYPTANKELAQRMAAGRRVAMLGAVQNADPAMGPAAVQAAGAAAAQVAGQAQVQQATQAVQANAQAAGTGVAAQGVADRARLADRRLALAEKARENDRRLSSLGLQTDRAEFETSLQIRRDKAGLAAFTAQQLADYAAVSARSRESYLDRVQDVQLAHERKLSLLKTAQARLEEQVRLESEGRIQAYDQATRERVARAIIELKEAQAREAAAQANRMAAWQAGGMIVGAAAGAYVSGGSPQGAAMGAQAGGGAATAIGGAAESKRS